MKDALYYNLQRCLHKIKGYIYNGKKFKRCYLVLVITLRHRRKIAIFKAVCSTVI